MVRRAWEANFMSKPTGSIEPGNDMKLGIDENGVRLPKFAINPQFVPSYAPNYLQLLDRTFTLVPPVMATVQRMPKMKRAQRTAKTLRIS
jgi:hypothetical protein